MRREPTETKHPEREAQEPATKEREHPKHDDDIEVRFVSWDLPLVSG